MSKKALLKFIAILLVTVLAVLGLGKIIVQAVDLDGPLTKVIITKVESGVEATDITYDQIINGIEVGEKVIPGVSFTYYSVTESQLNTMKATPSAYGTATEVEALDEGVGIVKQEPTAETNDAGQVTLDLAEGNYWFVENTKAMIASSTAVPFALALPFVNEEGTGYLPVINVYPKNVFQDVPVVYAIDKFVNEKKVDNVAIGENNVWRISVPLPEKIEDYAKFGVIDEIDSRLNIEEINNVFAVADNGNELIKGTDYTVNINKDSGQIGTGPIAGKSLAGKVTVEFTKSGLVKLKGSKEVNISIDKHVNETAIMGQKISNNVVLNFDNGDGSDHTLFETICPELEPYVYTGGKGFIKQDENNSEKLVGAEFIIKNAAGKYVKVGPKGAITFGTRADATAFESKDQDESKMEIKGTFEVKGLPYGKYILVETKAPAGYAMPTNPETNFVVSEISYHKDPAPITVGTNPSDDVQLINNRKLTIPQTGGFGMKAFTIIGVLLMIFSILYYKGPSKKPS